mgnify:CR=1 FL=1
MKPKISKFAGGHFCAGKKDGKKKFRINAKTRTNMDSEDAITEIKFEPIKESDRI